MVRPPTFSDLLARPALIAASPPPIVTISPGSQVTAQDIAQFDARWMSAADCAKRLDDHKYGLKNRQVMFAWGVFDDASAMVRMFELTHDPRYLDYLRAVNRLALMFRDDQHPGDDFPPRPEFPPGSDGDNPVCINCRPPLLVDRVRGKVVPAWGSGILSSDFVINGGLNPVLLDISGVYVYGTGGVRTPRRRASRPPAAGRLPRRRHEVRQRDHGDHVGIHAGLGHLASGELRGGHLRLPTPDPDRQPVPRGPRARHGARPPVRPRALRPDFLKLIDEKQGRLREAQRLRRQTTVAQHERGIGDVVDRAVARPR